jgi:hypothetical protein
MDGPPSKQVEQMIVEKTGVRYILITFTALVENGVLNRKYRWGTCEHLYKGKQ